MATITVMLKKKGVEEARSYWEELMRNTPWRRENRSVCISGIHCIDYQSDPVARTIVKISGVEVSISGESNANWDEAWNRALTIGGKVHLLIVGDTADLDEHLVNDVLIVAKQANLPYDDVKDIVETWPDGCDSKAVTKQPDQFILSRPSKAADIDEILSTTGETYICAMHIYYSGHGTTDGSWVLPDGGEYTGEDFASCVNNMRFTSGLSIQLHLNCCFAARFVGLASAHLTTKAKDAVPPLREVDAIPALVNLASFLSVTQGKRFDKVKRKMGHCLTNPSDPYNSTLTKDLVKLSQRDFRIFQALRVESQVGNVQLHMVPYSFGWLDATGAFFSLYNLQQGVARITPNAAFLQRGGAKRADMTRELDQSKQLPKAEALEIYIFGAGCGDSSLVRFPGCNILIDGGIHKNPLPCFWQLVRRLPSDEKLDVVVCTHYDEDHLAGLQRLLDECTKKRDLIRIGCLYAMRPPSLQAAVAAAAAAAAATARSFSRADPRRPNWKYECSARLTKQPLRRQPRSWRPSHALPARPTKLLPRCWSLQRGAMCNAEHSSLVMRRAVMW
jgi:hypothetical protein